MTDLEAYRKDFEIVRLTAEQLIKDFGMHGFRIDFSGNELTAWNELKMQVQPILYDLYQKNKSSFQALLYRIDISEKQLRELYSAGKGDFPEMLAEAVLRREFQKVLIRKFYSGTTDKPEL